MKQSASAARWPMRVNANAEQHGQAETRREYARPDTPQQRDHCNSS
jgi:hypothetical protein